VTVHKDGTHWTVMERGDYPADMSKLRKLLAALRDAKIIEEKTADPARYAEIGVEDPIKPGATGAEITVIASADKLGLIVGKPVGEGNFVRRTGEKTSYSVEPAIAAETDPRFWIDTRLIDVPAASIQSIEVKPASGPGYTIRRSNAADSTFSLEGAPPGRKPLEAAALAPGSSTLAGLDAEDVSPAADVDFSQASQATVTLTDGNVLTLTGTVIAAKHWLSVKASKDAALTGKAQGRAFEIASYRYDAIFKPLEQMLVPKEGAATPPGAPGSHPTKRAAPQGPTPAAPTPAAPSS
jgi:hypothetical protein